MKNKALQDLLINNITANTQWKPIIIGDHVNCVNISLSVEYAETLTCQFIITIHYDMNYEEISLLNTYSIDGYICSRYMTIIEDVIDETNAMYRSLTDETENK